MATFTPTGNRAKFTSTDGGVSFTASGARASFQAGYQSVTGGGSPTGGAGGFLSGTYPNPGVNTEALQDAVGAMAGLGLTYDDTAGEINVGDAVAMRWEVDHIGAFGPGFDILVPFGIFGPLDWGDDYYLTQSPQGQMVSVQASEGDALCCTSYLTDSFTDDVAEEGLHTLTGGVWVRDATQPAVGELVVGDEGALYWQRGVAVVHEPGGHFEVVNQQYFKAALGQSAVIEAVSGDGTDGATLSGAVLGTSLIDASSGPVARTMFASDELARGKRFTWVKVDSTGNDVTITPDGADTINGATDPYVLSAQWDHVSMMSDGDGGWIIVGSTAGGGTVDVVSNVAQDRILGRTASGSGDSEELTGSQVLSLIGAVPTTRTLAGLDLSTNRSASDLKAALAIPRHWKKAPPASSYAASFSGMFGMPPWDIAGNVTAEAYAAGTMVFGWCEVTGSIATVTFEVSASSLSAGQSVTLACYALNSANKPTGSPLWTETKTVGTSTGVFNISLTRDLGDQGCILGLLNPSGNAGSVTIYNFQPTGPYHAATRAVSVRPALTVTGQASPPDLTGYTYGTAAAANVMGISQRMPLLYLKG